MPTPKKLLSFPTSPTTSKKGLRSDGRYQVEYDIGIINGTRKKKAFYGKTLKEATAKMNAFKKEYESGLNIDKSKQPVSAWALKWQQTYLSGISKSSITTYGINVKKIIAAIGDIPLRDVRKIDIQTFANSMADYSKSTVNKIKITIDQIFKEAVFNDYITKNPCDGVKWTNCGEGTHRALEDYERQTITDTWQMHRAGVWSMIMLFAGLRRGEALALTWDNIDLNNDVIHMRQAFHFESNTPVLGPGKTAAAKRTIPIMRPLKNMLESLPRTSQYLCMSASDEVVTETAFRRGWQSYQNYTGLSLRSQDLRHTFCTMLYDSGVDVKTAQLIMGHSDITITLKIYAHLSKYKHDESMGKMQEYTNQYLTDNLTDKPLKDSDV